MTSDWAKMLLTLFRQMYADGKRCENWDLILGLHDEEDRQYFLMLEKSVNALEAGK